MAAAEAFWRRIGRALLVCLVALTVLAPSFDSLLCLDEDFPAAVAAEHTHAPSDGAQFAQAGGEHEDAAPAHGPDGAVCAHGHCHHGGAYAAVAGVSAHRIAEGPALLVPVVADATLYDLQFGLERPPRA